MEVVFERVDARRYPIGVRRNARTDVGVDITPRPAPGHADVPHDLVHFVVEEQAELPLGIYGQVAAGGEVGGFFRPDPGARHKAADQRRYRRLGSAGAGDVDMSERLLPGSTRSPSSRTVMTASWPRPAVCPRASR